MKNLLVKFKVDGVALQPFSDKLELSQTFDKNEVINRINEKLKDLGFVLDEQSIGFIPVENQVYLIGIAIELSKPLPHIRARFGNSNRR